MTCFLVSDTQRVLPEWFDISERWLMFGVDEADLYELDEYVSQEEAMQMALRETFGPHGQQPQSAQPNPSFSDDEYDDIFMTISDPVQAGQAMDMS